MFTPSFNSSIISFQTLDAILNGDNNTDLRFSKRWPGVMQVARKGAHPFVMDWIQRGKGRTDMTLGRTFIQRIVPKSELINLEKAIADLKNNCRFTSDVKWKAHIMIVSPGGDGQPFHVDAEPNEFYFTMIFPLTHDCEAAGGTEFKTNVRRPKVGECLIFDGKTLHRGEPNQSNDYRIFMYIACYSGEDEN